MAIKNFICNRIQYAFAYEVSSTSDSEITLNGGYTIHTLQTLSANLSQDLRQGDAGTSCQQRLSVKSEDADQGLDFTDQELIFKLTLEDGSVKIFGSLTEPARFTGGTRELEGISYNFERVTATDIL